MSHDTLHSETLVSRRRALGAGLFLLAGAMVGLGTSSALAQSRGGGRGGGGSPNGGGIGGGGGDLIPPGTPGNCVSGSCGQQKPMMAIKPKPEQTKIPEFEIHELPKLPKPHKPKPRRRRTRPCDAHRIDGKIDPSCRNPD